MRSLWNEFVGSRDKLQTSALVVGGTLVGLLGAYTWKMRQNSSSISPHIRPEGSPKTTSTEILQGGSKLFQSKAPLKGFDIYLVGFHPMVDDPCHQMEAHHYCKQVNEDFAQCFLFDGNTADANLTGIEYIISERLFEELPSKERQFWHPHNFEIMSGMLAAPGLPVVAEKALLKAKLNSYGKTIHTWRAKCWEGDVPYFDKLPKGEPLLGWSFNHDGEIRSDIILAHELAFNTTLEERRRQRKSFTRQTHPQEGVDVLLSKFKNPDELRCLQGVVDAKEDSNRK